ncbi:CG0192 family protein [Corynebacterium timonense]|uniref:Maltokinase N-terminal cap domain-containing protein n=1 Tax=Corynebacterium timonense TaxID=441500 RepID=A0A1H1LDS4_9CORY|nr:hypothetical protein [Corynebacterium timonense]SDR71999.1 hypothetical protein SAMN04488539_0147 [Corynebacterium timonense]
MATAEIYDAELNPTKEEVAAEHSRIVELSGTYRVVDPDDVVGIEVLVGKDADGNLAQLALTYRPADRALDSELLRMQHSELGERSVAYLTDDPVAVREIITTIMRGAPGADFDNGEPIFAVRGNGHSPEMEVTEVEIQDCNGWTSIGTALFDGEQRQFQLRIQRFIQDQAAAADELALVTDADATLIRLEVWD